mgnify:FL=1
MSIYNTVSNVLVRDYEVARRLTDSNIENISMIIMEELRGYENEECTEQFIYEVAGEVIETLISGGIKYERNID